MGTLQVLVTGCAGFIGSRVAEVCLEEGHDVVGIDNLSDAYDVRLKQWRLGRLTPRKGFTFLAADISRIKDIEPAFARGRFDSVLNLAARAGVRQSIENPWVYVDTNVTGTLNMLELARRHDSGSVLLASTSSLYGAHNPRPYAEIASTDRPLSPYAASKKGAEALMATYAHLYGLPAPVVRYFTVYGPAGRPDMSMFRFVRGIAEGEPIVVYGDGLQERDFTFVDDTAHGTLIAARRIKGHDIVNLGSDRPVTLTKMIETIEAALGKRARIETRPMHIADVRATWADITKARHLLGWEPRTSFEEGVRATVDWYLKNREWARSVDLGAV